MNFSFPLKDFRRCVQEICSLFNISLQENQFQALYSFVCGEDVFVNLPTGFGKSLVFQMAPIVHLWMNKNVSAIHWKDDLINYSHQSAFSSDARPSKETLFSGI